jgi:uncharacterized protein (TIGR03435 family)
MTHPCVPVLVVCICRSPRYMRGLSFLLVVALPVVAQNTPDRPQFDVVSIKLNNTVPNIVETPPLRNGRLDFTRANLKTMIGIAYKVRMPQITGGPAWVGTDRYDVAATSSELSPSEDRYRSMLRNMLEDRFHLAAHRETRDTTLYALVLGKNGLKIPPADPGSCVPLDPKNPAPPPTPTARCGSANITANRLLGTGMTATGLANALTGIVGRTVVDKTGLTGTYNIHLDFTRESTVFNAPPAGDGANADASAPSIFTALQEQLGLRLESQKGTEEVVVIDHADKPSEN